ncbi:MAG: M20 family metallopeptidase [Candidatus Hydrogenedentota bacterium]
MHDELKPALDTILPKLIELRHELHAHPEIRFEEHWTSGRIARFLDDLGAHYTRGHAGGTGIVVTVEGSHPGPAVLLRADIDALEIQEQTDLPYASTIPERMHACGHDGHSAGLCGAIHALMEHRDRLHGTVKCVFQPAEELAAGGRRIVEEGVLDGVDAAFALHGWPSLPLGRIALRPGWMMASANCFRITVRGKGCHGAAPHDGVDPILVAAHITTALQAIVSRELDPGEAGVVTIGSIHGGCSTNVIPDTAIMEGTLRSIEPARFDIIAEAIERVASHTARAFRAEAETVLKDTRYPSLYNDPEATHFARETAERLFGEGRVMTLPRPVMAAEDFAFYLQKAPGAFVYLGVNPHPDREYPGLHTPYYDFNDDALPIGAALLASLALDYSTRFRAAESE